MIKNEVIIVSHLQDIYLLIFAQQCICHAIFTEIGQLRVNELKVPMHSNNSVATLIAVNTDTGGAISMPVFIWRYIEDVGAVCEEHAVIHIEEEILHDAELGGDGAVEGTHAKRHFDRITGRVEDRDGINISCRAVRSSTNSIK